MYIGASRYVKLYYVAGLRPISPMKAEITISNTLDFPWGHLAQ